MCQRYAGTAITGQIKTTLAEADLPTVATRATQLSKIAMKKSLLTPDENAEKQVATAKVNQRTKKAN